MRPFILMTLLSFLIGAGNVFIDAASSAMFLAEYGAEQLPWVYVVASAVMIASGYGYAQLECYVRLSRLMSGTMLLLFLTTATIKLGLDLTGNRQFIFAALVWYRLLFIFSDLVFWAVAGVLFSLQQGKRLFGLVSTGNVLARILSYLVIPLIVGSIGSSNLLYLSALLLASAWLLVWAIMRGVTPISAETQKSTTTPHPTGVKAQRPQRYIYYVYTLFCIGSISYYLVGFNFYAQAGIQFNDADTLAGFFGLFSGAVNICVLLANTFATSRVLRRFGLIRAMFSRPVLLFGLATAALILLIAYPTATTSLFVLTLVTRFLDLFLYYGLYRPSITLLYQPLPQSLRVAVQSITEGVAGSISLGVAGILLIVIGPENLLFNSISLVVVIGLWIAVMIGIRNEYATVLKQALYTRLLNKRELDLEEAETLSVIRAKLISHHPSDVIYAIELLERVGPPDLVEAVIGSLTHENPLVRIEAARRAARLQIGEALPRLKRSSKQDKHARAKIEAIMAWSALAEDADIRDADISHIFQTLDATSPAQYEAVLTGLLRGNSAGGQRQARASLRKLLGGSSAERIQACNIIRDARRPELHSWLVAPLNDQNRTVRHAAIHAAGATVAPQLWEHLLTKLDDKFLQKDAIQALAESGRDVLPLVISEFKLATTLGKQAVLIRIATRINHPDSLVWLSQFIRHNNVTMRNIALRGLYRNRYTASGEMIPLVEAQVSAEIEHAAHILAAMAQLDEREEFDVLFAALEGVLAATRQQIFRLLSFMYDRSLLKRIEENLRLDAADRRAYAVELLDIALPNRVKQPLLPLIESADVSSRLTRLQAQYTLPQRTQMEWLCTIILGEPAGDRPFSAWVRATAIYAVGKLQLNKLIPMIQTASNLTDPLVTQTAEWVLHTEFKIPSIRTVFMMPTIEKVIILRSVSLFASIPESILVRVADLLNETVFDEGHTLFAKGDYGDKMYIIVTGKVRVHVGDETLNFLGDRDVFGEMALLDPEPRVASVTTVEPSMFLSLDQEPLFELMEDHPAVARGLVSVLSSHLRDRVSDLRTARNRIAELETMPTSIQHK